MSTDPKRVTVRRFAYLKTPLWSYSIESNDGGSLSNSGMIKSRAALIRHVFGAIRHRLHVNPVLCNVYAVDGDGKETLEETLTLI